jgi:hypothetical protein
MMSKFRIYTLVLLLLPGSRIYAADPPRSWNETAPKRAIIALVEKVTKESSPAYVPGPMRIATFNNDGTLWVEKPVPFEIMFAFDRVKALAPQHPEWSTKEPFASVLMGNMAAVAASGERGVLAIVAARHTGMTTEEFSKTVQDWIAAAKHLQTAH